MSKFKVSNALSGNIEAWHCGRDLSGGMFSLDFLGSGEGINYLGPGIYFASDKDTALGYARFINKPFIYKCSFPADGLYDSAHGEPLHLREKIIALNEKLSQEFGKKYINPTDSFKYGKDTIGFLHEKFGRSKALTILQDMGINGAYENLPGGVIEYCMFDTNRIQIVGRELVGDHTDKEPPKKVFAPISNAKIIEWYDGVDTDFEDYGYSFFANRTALVTEPEYENFPGPLKNLEDADRLAAEVMKEKPDTVILHYKDQGWMIGSLFINKTAQIRQNYDYPYEGLYTNLDKYKSVSDFRKKRRSKRKQDIKNILDSRPDRYKAKK